MAFWDKKGANDTPPNIDDIYASPGHLIRRCHQISSSIFSDEMGELGLTPIQYASLLAIKDQPDIDQRSLSKIIAIDRSTVGTVLQTLEKKSLIERSIPKENQRIKTARISPKADELLEKTSDAIAEVQRRLLEPLSSAEQLIFLGLLQKLVIENNEKSRAPLDLSTRTGRSSKTDQ